MMNGSRRVFVGLSAPAELQGVVQQFFIPFSGRPFRRIAPEHLHLTLVPPWQCRDIGPVCRKISEMALRYAPFPLVFKTVAPGPGERKPRLLWAATDSSPLLLQFRHELASAFADESGTGHEFFPHMTIARFRPGAFADLRLEPVGVEWPVVFDRLCLYESLPGPSGAVYCVLCSAYFGTVSAGPGN